MLLWKIHPELSLKQYHWLALASLTEGDEDKHQNGNEKHRFCDRLLQTALTYGLRDDSLQRRPPLRLALRLRPLEAGLALSHPVGRRRSTCRSPSPQHQHAGRPGLPSHPLGRRLAPRLGSRRSPSGARWDWPPTVARRYRYQSRPCSMFHCISLQREEKGIHNNVKTTSCTETRRWS